MPTLPCHHPGPIRSRGMTIGGVGATAIRSGSRDQVPAVVCRGRRDHLAKIEQPRSVKDCAGVWGGTTPIPSRSCLIPRRIAHATASWRIAMRSRANSKPGSDGRDSLPRRQMIWFLQASLCCAFCHDCTAFTELWIGFAYEDEVQRADLAPVGIARYVPNRLTFAWAIAILYPYPDGVSCHLTVRVR